MPTLAKLLSDALPELTETIVSGGFLQKKTVCGVRVTLGDYRYDLNACEKGPIRAQRTHLVRGIALKSDPVEVSAWLAEVGEAIEVEMRTSQRARSSLNQLLGP